MHDFIRGIFLNPAAGIARETLVEERCDDFYTLLDCNVIDIVTRSVGGKAFSIVCDDEGLLKPDPCISATSRDTVHGSCLVGRLFICARSAAHLRSLKDEDVDLIMSRLRVLSYNGKENLGLEMD